MNNYHLLTTEQIPDCCGSCKSLRLIPNDHGSPWCRFTEENVCLFGLCSLYKRRNTLR
jgi:hypothetical protein